MIASFETNRTHLNVRGVFFFISVFLSLRLFTFLCFSQLIRRNSRTLMFVCVCVTIFLKITLFIFSSFGIKLSQCIRSHMYLVITLVNVSLNWRFRWYIFFLLEELFPKVESLSFTSFLKVFFFLISSLIFLDAFVLSFPFGITH